MSVRGRSRILALSAVAGCCLMAAPAQADDCIAANCDPQPPVVEAKPEAPLRLEKFRRQPVALGKPTQVVKKPNGHYVKVRLNQPGKPKVARKPGEPSPEFFPVVVSPVAAAALAMQENVTRAAAYVRVVDADELNEIDLAAAETPVVSDAPLVAIQVPTTIEPPIRVNSVQELIDHDHRAALAATASAATAAPISAKPPAVTTAGFDLSAWLWRCVASLGDGLAALFAAARALLG